MTFISRFIKVSSLVQELLDERGNMHEHKHMHAHTDACAHRHDDTTGPHSHIKQGEQKTKKKMNLTNY
jgi:hypothetical protein